MNRRLFAWGSLLLMATAGAALGQDKPVNATCVGQWDGLPGPYADVWGDGDFAYIGHFGDSAVHIVDISDPVNPVAIEYELPTDCLAELRPGTGTMAPSTRP